MAYVIADNIISPLGDTTEANYQALKQGKSGLRKYAATEMHVPQDYVASLLSDQQIKDYADVVATEDLVAGNADTLSRFELIALTSARKAIKEAGIDVSGNDIVFILSSTKGSVEEMRRHDDVCPRLGESAQRIARRLGITTQPIVVCNACISGVSALVLAQRLLQAEAYRYAVVCGADSPSRFIISGFQSLKALSTEECRPFDMERFGLNLGEAAATLVLSRESESNAAWQLINGAVKNDAYHISAPSKTGEGLYNALQQTLHGVDAESLALVSAHGTATLFNDQMESVAIERAGLSQVPVNALKGYFGHTLGAAGILETILCMKQVDDNTVIGTRGFTELGVSGKIIVTAEHCKTDKQSFVKLISGFGGCNATILGTKQAECRTPKEHIYEKVEIATVHTLRLSPQELVIDGKQIALPAEEEGKDMLTCLYKQCIDGYPKFYKMDVLSKLAFVASELLLQAEGKEAKEKRTDRAIILFNSSSSVVADRKYLESIEDEENCFPSPSVFVYTLPNIATGEIAIRNGYQGETSFYIIPERNSEQMNTILQASFLDSATQSALTGWVDYNDGGHYEAELQIVVKK
jgi:3-oxoacyl-[acyl-carrier-protein] synthase I